MDAVTIGIIGLLIISMAIFVGWSTKRRSEETAFRALLRISDSNLREKAITLFVNRYPRFLKRSKLSQ